MLGKKGFDFGPDGSSSSSSDEKTEPGKEQDSQRLTEIAEKYAVLQAKIADGELVEPDKFLKSKIEAGEIFTKERYTGLQQTFQKEQDAHSKARTDLEKLQQETAAFQSNLEKLTTDKTALETSLQEKDAKVLELEKKEKRAEVIFSQFPHLASFEADGLLPDAPEDKLPDVFGKFSQKLETMKVKGAEEFGSGGGSTTPPSKSESEKLPGDPPKGSRALYNAAMEAFSGGNHDEYNKLYDKYLEALSEEAAT